MKSKLQVCAASMTKVSDLLQNKIDLSLLVITKLLDQLRSGSMVYGLWVEFEDKHSDRSVLLSPSEWLRAVGLLPVFGFRFQGSAVNRRGAEEWHSVFPGLSSTSRV